MDDKQRRQCNHGSNQMEHTHCLVSKVVHVFGGWARARARKTSGAWRPCTVRWVQRHMLGFGGGNHTLREEWTTHQLQHEVHWICLGSTVGEIQSCTSTSEIRMRLMSLAIQCPSHCIRGQDGGQDFRSTVSPDLGLSQIRKTGWFTEVLDAFFNLCFVLKSIKVNE